MDLELLRRLYSRCDPSEPLSPGDDRYVDVDAMGVRGESLVEQLTQDLESATRPQCLFVASVPGTGMSTELRRLAERLSCHDGARYLIVRVDGDEVFDLRSPLTSTDILLALLAASEELLTEAHGEDPSLVLRQHFLAERLPADRRENLVGLLPRTVMELKTDPPLRDRLRERLASDGQFFNWVYEELLLLQEFARRHGHAGLVLICDSLERIDVFGDQAEEILDSVRHWSRESVSQLELPVHLVCTLPLALALGKQAPPVRILPAIRISELTGKEPSHSGMEAVREIILRRIPERHFRELFGNAFEKRLEQLAAHSAGWLRELVRLLRDFVVVSSSAVRSRAPLSESDLRQALTGPGDELRRRIPEEGLRLLSQRGLGGILSEGKPFVESLTITRLISMGALLPVFNGDLRLGTHPEVERLVHAHATV